jgi:ABC-type nickel/cobalt efflux system permease component RcnA
MFGLDDWLAGFSDGASVWLVLLVAVGLGLRHATDPDHLAAVTTLVAGTRERASRAAAVLGLAWGAGHALTLFAFGLPILLLDAYVPERAQQAAETAVALVIAYLGVRLIVRWRRGQLHLHVHEHHGVRHQHLHDHRLAASHGHPHRARTPLGAFAIGLVHGMGGSAGVGVLLVAAVETTWLAVASLVLLAAFTAVSMTIVSTGFGVTLVSRPVRAGFDRIAPTLALASLAFGAWYGTAAWGVAPYPF